MVKEANADKLNDSKLRIRNGKVLLTVEGNAKSISYWSLKNDSRVFDVKRCSTIKSTLRSKHRSWRVVYNGGEQNYI